MSQEIEVPLIKPTDLRGILKYVPQFRAQCFVIAIDGSILEDDNFANVATDLAVLKSLNIRLVLTYGIGQPLRRLAAERGVRLTDEYGIGPTDEQTLELAIEASGLAAHKLSSAMAEAGLRTGTLNAVQARPAGLVRGVEQQLSGRVERIDRRAVETLLDNDLLPVLPPICYDRDGQALRLNSDHLAAELAIQVKASKLIYLTPFSGLAVGEERIQNIPVDKLEKRISGRAPKIEPRLLSKARCAIEAMRQGGPQRAHILDGRVFGGLLIEIFDKVGLGTMIHGNDYQSIRPAQSSDLEALHNIVRAAAQSDALRPRSRRALEQDLEHFYVYEIDGSIIGCFQLVRYARSQTLELASVYVHPYYKGRGIGGELLRFAIAQAKKRKAKKLVALSTQAEDFFLQQGFGKGRLSDLPKARAERWKKEARQSKILVRAL